ncbi:transposase [Sulfitobacter geojensis]|uniref:Transposase n=2 Tax=Sulfitobacter geojensis TaxID=1342299 RepID=A0AAE2VV13_9RHOB|nr:transposase [Sulfitobacter geojensis]MBM1712236.1 transposase [Sulfitobacter geojensis]MBM1728499.1 transposase [Sulfitobacter geojensis]MBM1736631.1 transposase [Sulfitobacter geojensis]MBM1756962.1 transposase [Sulfitobacter geojensis]MBM1761025.1 transposase [Sulfitobacter geojensis]
MPSLAFCMSSHVRQGTTGATYFFTLRLADRQDDLLLRKIDLLRSAMRETLQRHPFHIDATAVLPATVHMMWTLPAQDDAYASRIALLKSRFSRACPMPAHRSLAQIKRGEKGIWQRRYWEHAIRDAGDFARHRDLIHLSPVHAGLCARPQDWVYTSLHRYLRDRNMRSGHFRQGTATATGHTSKNAVQKSVAQHVVDATL